MRDLRPSTLAYFYLRQVKNRIVRDGKGRALTPFKEEWFNRRISAIGHAIMHVRALEIEETAA